MKKVLIVLCLALCISALLPTVALAENSVQISSREAILVAEDGTVLLEKNSTEKRPIASMTKIMTLLCVYDAVDAGKISLDDDVVVSRRAASMGGSQVFLDANSAYKAENLVKSIIICSANDSCVALAEHIAGSMEAFVEQMNAKAQQLGLVATHFENCTGLPHVSQFSCAQDVATMLSRLIRQPHYMSCAGIWMEDFVHSGGRVTGMTNTNKLVRFYEGCDAGKTGFTNEAQHCLAATAKRGNTRVISVVVGAPDSKTRFKEVSDMFNFAFANFENKLYLSAETPLDPVKVVGGKKQTVDVAPSEPLCHFGKKGEKCQLQLQTEPQLKAPVSAGDVVGTASLVKDGQVISQTTLVAKTDVAQKTYWDYLKDAVGAR